MFEDNKTDALQEKLSSGNDLLQTFPEESKPRRWRWLRFLVVMMAWLVILLAGMVSYIFSTLPNVAPLKKENPKITAMMEYREAEAKAKGSKLRRVYYYVPLSRISPLLWNAVLIAEDDKFFQHEGFDWDGIKQAIDKNLERKRVVMGGSTITQQLAKNLFLKPSRTPWRKIREAIIAMKLERELDKRRILELYLNVVEWGNGIYGIEAAARTYYQKSAADLDASQSIRLASVLVNPQRYSPFNDRNRRMRNKRLILAERMFKRHLIDEETYQWLIEEFHGTKASP